MASAAESVSRATHVRRQLPVLATGTLAVVALAALVAFPDGLSTLELASVGALTLLVVAATGGLTGGSVSDALFAGFVVLALGGTTWTLLAADVSLLVTTLVLASVVALVSYGLHRYELVALGLVEGES